MMPFSNHNLSPDDGFSTIACRGQRGKLNMLYWFLQTASKSCSQLCVKKISLQSLHLHVVFFITSYKSDIQLTSRWNLTISPKNSNVWLFFRIILHYLSFLTTFCYGVLNFIFDFFSYTLQIVQVKKRACCIFAKKWIVIGGLLTLFNYRTKNEQDGTYM